MNQLETHKTYCPCCGELIELVLDCSVVQQHYVEDCQVCCRPLEVTVEIVAGADPLVSLSPENA